MSATEEVRPAVGRNVSREPTVESSRSGAKAEPSTPDTKVESSSKELVIENEKGSSEDANGMAEDTKIEDEEIVYPTGLVLAAIVLALDLAVLLVALDQTIIATAIPRITDQFQSVKDIGWYGAVCLVVFTFLPCTHIVLGLFLDVYFSST